MSMWRVLKVHLSGYYAWKLKPLSNRAIEDAALLVEKNSPMKKVMGLMAVHVFTMIYVKLVLFVARTAWLKSCAMPNSNLYVAIVSHAIS